MLNRSHFIRLATVVTFMVAVAQASGADKEIRKSFLELLAPGQTLSLEEKSGRYDLTLLSGTKLPMTITEIGVDYVALRDVVHTVDLVIPIYSIRSIKTIRLPAANTNANER